MFEGSAEYPDSGRFCSRRQAQGNTFYTGPTAIRALMREGRLPVKKWQRRVAPVGHGRRPIIRKLGNGIGVSSRWPLPIVDWWQPKPAGF